MIRVILIAAISVDGKIAERTDQSSLDWTSKEDRQFFVKRTKEAGVVIMGRKTFETIGRPLKERLTMVMTSATEGKTSQESVLEYTAASPKEILEDLDRRGYKEVAVCGGSSVYGQFLKEGLVDELFLTIEPVLFGGGVQLASGFDRINMELVDYTKLNDQAVFMHYRVRH